MADAYERLGCGTLAKAMKDAAGVPSCCGQVMALWVLAGADTMGRLYEH